MTTLTLQQTDLVEGLAQAAAEQNTTPEKLLHTAVSEYLEKFSRQKIHAESEAFKAMHADLVKKYPGQYVAIHNGQVIDHDQDARTLYLRMREKYGPVAVLIRQVTEKVEQELVFRSPRLTKEKP